jgi:uncharacterized membrane protein YfcA
MPASNPLGFDDWLQNDGDNLPPASTGVYDGGDFQGVLGVERYLRRSAADLSVVTPTHPTQQPDLVVVGADQDSKAVQAPAILDLKETIAKPIGKSMWMPVAILFLAVVVVAYAARNSGTAMPGLGVGKLITIELILFLSGLMSGLSGFGFSAVGAGCLLFIEPITEAPLLQSLSTCNQFLSLKQLAEDMPKSWKGFWEGPGFCILGGMPGAFVGIWMLSHLPAEQLMKIFGALLVLYAIYSMVKPAGARIRGFDGPVTGAIVGFIGGAIGGFTAFPGAAVVVWTSLRDLPKAQSRAVVQPYIIMSQIFSLILIALLHSNYLSYHYWMLLLITLPAVLPGTAIGVMIYRRISDVNFKRVSYLLLGLSGVALLLKVYGPILARLF